MTHNIFATTRLILTLCTVLSAVGAKKMPPSPPHSVWKTDFKGGEPEDIASACESPGIYAWRVFVAINYPAKSGLSNHRGLRSPNSTISDPGLRVWQTWKYEDEAHPEKGQDPGSFDTPPLGSMYAPYPQEAVVKPVANHPGSQIAPAKPATPIAPTKSTSVGNEPNPHDFDTNNSDVRYNRAAYDYLRQESLYNVEGQEARFANNKPVDLPFGSIVLKASWKNLGEISTANPERAKYSCMCVSHKVNGAQVTTVYGLDSVHIMSKEMKDWFWCTFEHVDNERPQIPDQGLPEIDPDNNAEFTLASSPHNWLLHYPIPLKLVGTVFANYRLAGVQTSFVTSTGQPTLLASSVLERPVALQRSSSCISCHAKASIGAPNYTLKPYSAVSARGLVYPDHSTRLNDFDIPPQAPSEKMPLIGNVGVPDPTWFLNSKGNVQFIQLDYLFSTYNANRIAH